MSHALTRVLSRASLVLTFSIATFAHAFAGATYYANPTTTDPECQCSTQNSACGTLTKPYKCLTDAVNRAFAGDKVIATDGIYNECVGNFHSGSGPSDTARVTIASATFHGALIACNLLGNVAVFIQANHVTFRGFRVTGGTTGVNIVGADPGENNAGTDVVVENTEVYGNPAGVRLEKNCADIRLTRLDIHDNAFDGLKLDTFGEPCTDTDQSGCVYIRNTTIEDSHIHHNLGNGILEGDAERTVIKNCEVDNNGAGTYSHGFYMKGFEGLIQNNKVHHNAGYGIQLWAAPRGSSTFHYIAERNDLFANGSGGIVLGGSSAEASPHPPLPPGDGFPHYVEMRYNTIHDNPGTGFVYYGGGCADSTNDNSFHHNTVSNNTLQSLVISAANESRLLLKNNIVVGLPYTTYSILVLLINTNLDADALDGNIYSMPGADAATTPGVFEWSCGNCPEPPPANYRYSFDQIRDPGIFQDNTRRPDLNCGSNTVKIDERSRWVDPLLVDPNGSSWPSAVGMTRGDFHLRRGSPAASGGVCCGVSNAGRDVDDEQAPVCSPATCDTSVSDVGVGADYPLDDAPTPANGVANRYECNPPNGTVCDGECPLEVSEADENMFCTGYPGAPYDPGVFPGHTEICDGKDNDCNPATTSGGGEADQDRDGFYAPCGQDCNDTDARTHPGAKEICDGIDNNCTNGIDEGCADSDADGSADYVDPDYDINVQVTPCPGGTEGSVVSGACTDLNAGSPNNTYEVLSEQTSGNKRKLTKVWTFNNVPTGKSYELVVEGFKTAGGSSPEASFDFSFVTEVSGWNCSTSDAFGPTILAVSTDDDHVQSALLGTISNPVVCLRVQDHNRGNDSQTDLISLDRVFLFQLPSCTDADGDGYAASCSACSNIFCPTTDCDDGDVLKSPGLIEGPSNNPTCCDNKDNDCDTKVDTQDTDCGAPLPDADADADTAVGPGTIYSGTYLNTRAPNEPTDTYEAMQEGVQAGHSRLVKTWRFDNVPGGTHTLHIEGYHLPSNDGDDFQFFFKTSPTGQFTIINNSTITQTTPDQIIDSASFGVGISGTIYIQIKDTNPDNSIGLDIVYIDHLIIRTTP